RPHSVVTLAPNATAYATVTTSTAGGPPGPGRPISPVGVGLAAPAPPPHGEPYAGGLTSTGR
ncbi:hypothetical protein ACFW1M_16595, partial [Streptomyces inhibens]|uniref:hypothetical protein n=1 Tax=Streptomyces inhibens TaxID=2293571 RepID=UPI0036B3614E